MKKVLAIMVTSAALVFGAQAYASQWYPVKSITCGTVAELATSRTEYEMGLLAATLYMRGMIRGAVDGSGGDGRNRRFGPIHARGNKVSHLLVPLLAREGLGRDTQSALDGRVRATPEQLGDQCSVAAAGGAHKERASVEEAARAGSIDGVWVDI